METCAALRSMTAGQSCCRCVKSMGLGFCRYCTEGAYFCVKEVDLAITADMGTLQRLPGIVGDGALPK